MNEEEKFTAITSHLNSLSLTNHFARTAITFAIVMVFSSFFATITVSGMITVLYYCIGFNVIMSFIGVASIYYLRAALAQCLLGLMLCGVKLFY